MDKDHDGLVCFPRYWTPMRAPKALTRQRLLHPQRCLHPPARAPGATPPGPPHLSSQTIQTNLVCNVDLWAVTVWNILFPFSLSRCSKDCVDYKDMCIKMFIVVAGVLFSVCECTEHCCEVPHVGHVNQGNSPVSSIPPV